MDLIKGETGFDCAAASIAMVVGTSLGKVKSDLFSDLRKPFTGKWAHIPQVPDMNIICDFALRTWGLALVPFEYMPTSTPHKDCPPVSVYPRNTKVLNSTPEFNWRRQLAQGPGLIEGTIIGKELGHMVAWTGKEIYDPRGYIYSLNVAVERFQFQVRRFWLALRIK
jgi:hypothetical protein